ncbi:MAG TPA: hypothetical protein VJ063_00515 [Verrucomicrobiae bacterium]|nr:hypothetical protein [Verrucomicrobiae bacterium]
MAAEFDASEFVDDDFQTARKGAGVAEASRAPSREEVDAKVTDMHQKLAELKRTQQELERERASLEDVRRRQVEFTTGRQEMIQSLTRGVGLLEEAEFAARRDAEQMAKALTGLREALEKVQALREEDWKRENLNMELTRALTTVENARMEWNSARLKFEILNGCRAEETASGLESGATMAEALSEKSYAELCKLGLALTWPLALAGLGIFVVLLVFLLR